MEKLKDKVGSTLMLFSIYFSDTNILTFRKKKSLRAVKLWFIIFGVTVQEKV